MLPKVYHLRKGQLHMVKNAKMFKERFDEIHRDISNKLNKSETRFTAQNPSDDTIAQLLLIELVPALKEVVTTNLSKRTYDADQIEDVLIERYPTIAKELRKKLIHDNKAYQNKKSKLLESFNKLLIKLRDEVIFNGKDPLEAIQELQAFKEE